MPVYSVCDVQLHPTDPYSDIRSDQTLQDLAFMIVPRLFQKECEKRKDFCKKNNIEFKLPKFKRKEGYIPGKSIFFFIVRMIRYSHTGHFVFIRN